ncbi:MAG TPA: peptidoglycan-binding domain-containing protein [Chitinophagaceae bacterium]|nr:peptidoglycan-binding domain-containing protein [Chitinophagaceae bacterium]
MPALLTPDLLFRIWQNFNRYHWNGTPLSIHRIAVSDLLLSPLCREAGFELYELQPDIRLALLKWLKAESGPGAVNEKKLYPIEAVARFVESYHDLPNAGTRRWGERHREVQKLEALSWYDPDRAAKQLLDRIRAVSEHFNESELLLALDGYVKTSKRLQQLAYESPGTHRMRQEAGWMDAWKALLQNNTEGFIERLNADPGLLELLSDTAEGGIEIVMKQDTVEKIRLLSGKKLKALIVGAPGDASGGEQREVAVHSARYFCQVLEAGPREGGTELTILEGAGATRSRILEAWTALVAGAGEEEDLLLYLAGHADPADGHCRLRCAAEEGAPETPSRLTDAEIGRLAGEARCASVTLVLELDHAATPHWLDPARPGGVVYAAGRYEEPAGRTVVEQKEGPCYAFTYALAQAVLDSGQLLTNRRLFVAALEQYYLIPAPQLTQGSLGYKSTPQFSCHPDMLDRFFLQAGNLTAALQNELRQSGYRDGGPTGWWDPDTAVALKTFVTEAGLSPDGTKQEYIRQLQSFQAGKPKGRPLFLFVFNRPGQREAAIRNAEAPLLRALEALQQHAAAVEVILLFNPDKDRFLEHMLRSSHRNRVELLYFSGAGKEGNILLKGGGLALSDLVDILENQDRIRLLVSCMDASLSIAHIASQIGVQLAVGTEYMIFNADYARFAEGLITGIARGQSIPELLEQQAGASGQGAGFRLSVAPWFREAGQPLWRWDHPAPGPAAPGQSAYPALYALCVGIDRFDHTDRLRLPFSAENARRMHEYLHSLRRPGQPLHLAEEALTGRVERAQVLAALEAWDTAREGDTCLLFYSGAALRFGNRIADLPDLFYSDDGPFFHRELYEAFYQKLQQLRERNVLLVLIADVHDAVDLNGEQPSVPMPEPFICLKSCVPESFRQAERNPGTNHFFESLLELLGEGGGQLTYRELARRLQLRMAGKDWNGEYPVLTASPAGGADLVFLTRNPRQPASYTVHFDAGRNQWIVNAGTRQGIRPSLRFMATLFSVLGGPVVSVSEVFEEYSVVDAVIGEKARTTLDLYQQGTYQAVLVQNALPRVVIGFHPEVDHARKEDFLEATRNHDIHFVDIADPPPAQARYFIATGEQGFYLMYPTDIGRPGRESRPVFEFQRDPFEFIKQLEYIAKWQGVLELDNNAGPLGRTVLDIGFELIEGFSPEAVAAKNVQVKEQINPDQVVLHYDRVRGAWLQPYVECKVRPAGTEGGGLYVAFLYLDSRYGIVQLAEPQYAASNHWHYLRAVVQGRTFEALPLRVEKEYLKRGIYEVFNYLKVFVSVRPMDLTELTQEALRFGAQHYTRGIDLKTEQGTFVTGGADWNAFTVPIKIRHPRVTKGTVQAPKAAVCLLPDKHGLVDYFLEQGVVVEILEERDGWYRLGKEEWIEAADVRRDGDPKSPEQFAAEVKALYPGRPVTVPDDLQKNRWGGSPEANGRRLLARVRTTLIPGFFAIDASVESVDPGRPLSGQAAFFLHDSFAREIEFVTAAGGAARLTIPLAYEAFTLGAYLEDGTMLELDLNGQPGYPPKFYWKDPSPFRDRVRALYDKQPVQVPDDKQKGRWGGQPAANGKTLSATVRKGLIPGLYTVHLKVEGGDRLVPGPELAFFLHPSFIREIRFVPVVDGAAELKITAYESFTVGAYTDDGTVLELDLNEVEGFPEGFYYTVPVA